MKNKTICISPELFLAKKNIKKIITTKKYTILNQDPYNQINKLPKSKEIHIYDIRKNTQTDSIEKIHTINNHINKTGINPIRGKQKQQILFYDITEIYKQRKTGKVAECFGKKKRTTRKENKIETNFLCNYIICAHIAGFQAIYGYVVD